MYGVGARLVDRPEIVAESDEGLGMYIICS